MRILRVVITILALGPGFFMTFDGTRALVVGDYVTPSRGPYAGQLGPWSDVVAAVGIPPRSTPMKAAFVACGLAWLVANAAFFRRAPAGARMLAAISVLTLWYLPIGTIVSVAVLIGLAILRSRGHDGTRPGPR
jgi:hypothetical protein